MSTKGETYKSWKRFSDFKLLAEYAKISDLRDTVTAWTHIQQVLRTVAIVVLGRTKVGQEGLAVPRQLSCSCTYVR